MDPRIGCLKARASRNGNSKLLIFCDRQTDEQLNERTNKRTNRKTSSLRKAAACTSCGGGGLKLETANSKMISE